MKILILEDEKLAADMLERTLRELEPGAEIVGRLQTVSASIDWLQNNPHPDLIFSDIRLLDGLCFQVFETVDVQKPVIFTTAYDQYAIKAFEVNSVDYLLKPVQREKLRASIEKYRKREGKHRESGVNFQEVLKLLRGQPEQSYKTRFMARFGQKIVAVPAEKIAYFFSENKLTYIVSRDGKRYPLDQPLDELVNVLDPRMFFRVNRQFIITFDAIAEIHPYFKGRIKLALAPKTEEEVIISAERTPEFKKWIDQ